MKKIITNMLNNPQKFKKEAEKNLPFLPTTKEKQLNLLQKAWDMKNAIFLEDVLTVIEINPLEKSQIQLLNKLLLCHWHQCHEEIAFNLEELKDPSSVDFLYKAIFCNYEYLEWDDAFAFEVKCIWGLGEIANKEAIEYLQLLSKSSNELIKKNAIYQLERIGIK